MVQQTRTSLPNLFELDETAWLESMAGLIVAGQHEDLDFPHLAEYLNDMARRDRREVESRLEVLLVHLLKWSHQPDRRTPSWRGTVLVQRNELARLVKGVLRRHAVDVLRETYQGAREVAMAETELPAEVFPEDCPWSLDELLSANLLTE